MSDHSAFGFGKFVPGFDFLQNLAQSASQATPAAGAIPGMSSWVAPTLSVEEIDKRIQELKAVQFWLEQNGTALKATIQALEVQKMTLSTLQRMNVSMNDLAKAFTARAPEPEASTSAPEPPTAEPSPAPQAQEADQPAAKPKRHGKSPGQDSSAPSGVAPMAWWGSLTQQFQNIASAAMQDVAGQALKAQPPVQAPAADAPASQPKPRARKASGKSTARSAAAKAPRPSGRKRAG